MRGQCVEPSCSRAREADSENSRRSDWRKAGHRVIATVEIWPQVTALREEAKARGLTLEVEKLDSPVETRSAFLPAH
jgi:hypothetical protein